MSAALDDEKKTLSISQELTFYNQTPDTITTIILNDWNHAFSSKSTPLAKRFSDEFVRSFHLAKDYERGATKDMSIDDASGNQLSWFRPDKHPDLIEIYLRQKVAPGEKITLKLLYTSKIPINKFTKSGYSNDGSYNLRDWFVTPARYEDHAFVRYSNGNLDDIANGLSDFEIEISTPGKMDVVSDLDSKSSVKEISGSKYVFSGQNRHTFSLYIAPKLDFHSFRNDIVEVENGIEGKKVTDIQKAVIVDRIVKFVNENIGAYPYKKITVSEADYSKNPFYGLNQLPSFISPFPDSYLYEIKFLKTYLHNYLLASMRLDPRRDNWVYDGMQIYVMMKYIDEQYPGAKMMGSVSSLKILKGYHLVNLDFNEQYSYFYMLMARRNLDQPIGYDKNKLIKFNEQIAGKYRAGLSMRYLDNFLERDVVPTTIKDFYALATKYQTDQTDFEFLLKTRAYKNIDWFFETIINSRDIIDYKFVDLERDKDSVTVTMRNRTGTTVPIPVYGVKKGQVLWKEWIENVRNDSTFTFERKDADKIVINYKNEVPEYNLRNNWKSLKGFKISNRPIKFNFLKDLEDPYYNQILYVPTANYNLYDGLMVGMRLFNKTLLDKPLTFDLNPIWSTKTNSLTGSGAIAFNQNFRNSELYNMRYSLSGNYFHYAPDAAYYKINPMIQMRIRDNNFRDNRKEIIIFRNVVVHREASELVLDNPDENQNYSVFNIRYGNSRSEVTNTVNFTTDVQFAGKFGKTAVEFEYRRLFENNRQINVRFYAGAFLYNKTSNDFFSFALDRPTDYLFDYNYYGRSESSGLFSQQLILSEGGFKSKLEQQFANQWITTVNASFNVWNWIELYGDAGFVKSKTFNPEFVYDSGVRLNLVTDYFELYFPVYSNLGWEIAQPNYGEKIRFIVTIDPKTLVNLFTRKWF
ncbi:MAG: aminopeptidase [Flavobacterium sp.]|nr:aminopeptidase [Flavobacterium sp.]RZJ68353.1 MAG: aminopeptidase [Flavobacterium sp.]